MCIMHTIERRLFIFSGLLAVVQLGNTGPVSELPETSRVSKLMQLNTSDKFVKYFKELQLDKYCDLQLLNEESFKAYEIDDPNQCLCTVIYYMTKELDTRNVSLSSIEAAKNKTDNDTFNDPSVYETWKNVSKMSPFLKLLMEPLKDKTQFNKICFYGLNNAVSSYCKFLNIEVLLLHSFLPKPEESIKEDSVSRPEKIKKQIPGVLTEESKKSKTQLETDNDFLGDESDTEDAQKPNDENINFTTEDEMDQQTDLKDVDAPSKTKINSQSSNDYPKEDDGTLHTENKEIGLVFSRKNAFTNRGFGDTENSHFLFYFGIMTVLSMTFYLALYNKKKIIALLIEGRRSTNHRRRPNTASYSKVETDDGSTVF